MKCKIYLSDEGYGHIIRQKAITDSFLSSRSGEILFDVQTENNFEVAKKIFKGFKCIQKYNNISWLKLEDGSPNLTAIKKHYIDYLNVSSDFIKKEQHSIEPYDFLITDFVYEAFEIGSLNSIPTFGVAHFTWDWFFSKLYPPSVQTKVLDYLFHLSKKATKIYFPPFTPKEILKHYENSVSVPLIVRNQKKKQVIINDENFKILIIDSGSGLLKNHIERALKNVNQLNNISFYVPDLYTEKAENIKEIPYSELLINYIGSVDLVISRAGFNTISECIALRTPMLLIGEAMNPEIQENIINLKYHGLASFISLNTFSQELNNFLPTFINNEYKVLKESMQNHSFEVNGAEVIVEDILNHL